MNVLTFLCVVLTEISSVAGQIFFKHAMSLPSTRTRGKFLSIFLSGIAVKALAFFLWLGLLSKFDLSYLYPFEGLSPILLVLAAAIFLREKMSRSLWIGVLLISAGVMLVSAS
ncbi:MAG: hypothetical protein QOD99_2130 [Chthoniobacter sp.]|nr:hypothetical protein [Chthoniobacter sp.]